MKQEIIDFRNEIKALEQEQKQTKKQRKTVNFTGERTMEPYQANWKVLENKEKLRVMYAAYGLMRGRRFSEIENHWDKEVRNGQHPLFYYYARKINEVLVKHGYTMEYEETKNRFWGTTNKVFKENCDEKIIRLSEQKA